MHKQIKQRLSRQFLATMVAFMLVILILAGIFLTYSQAMQASYGDRQTKLSIKIKKTQALDNDVNQLLLDTRGYFAYGTPMFKTDITHDKAILQLDIKAFGQSANTKEDLALLKNIQGFYTSYSTTLLPHGMALMKKGDRAGLSMFSQQENAAPYSKSVLSELVGYQASINNQLNLQQSTFIHSTKMSDWYFLFFIFILLILATLTSVRLARRIGVPLNNLATASYQLSLGRALDLERLEVKREDELGLLSRAFRDMAISIQDKEQELTAQNEELVAQQDELQAQQEQLENLIDQMKGHEQVLERRNAFNLSLTQSLDKSYVLTSTIDNLVTLLRADKGLIIDLTTEEYAALGLSDPSIRRLLQHLDEGYTKRATESKQHQLQQRLGQEEEQGLLDEAPVMNDLYLPITSYRSGNEEVIALVLLTRMDFEFRQEEIVEVKGYSRQIALALDKLNLYEDTENNRRMNQSILNTIREGVHFVDECGVTQQVNLQWSEFLGRSPQDLMGEPLSVWLPSLLEKVADPKALEIFLNDVLSHKRKEKQLGIYQIDGEGRQVIQVYYECLVIDGENKGTIFVHRDITQEYELNRMKSELVNTISHELRTPLSSVLGFSERLMTKELTEERRKTYISLIHKESQRLTHLVNDFLDIQRMESGHATYVYNQTNLLQLTQEAVEPFEIEDSIHQFDIDNRMDVSEIFTDRDRLRQVLTNLISNAVKYSPDGGKVTVRLMNEGTQAVIHVQDEGLGIPEDAMDKIFTTFYRVDNSDHRKIGGTGLGLSLSKEMIRDLGGDLTVQSEFGTGSVFTIYLPLNRQASTQGSSAAQNRRVTDF